jgi:hypothetical protein
LQLADMLKPNSEALRAHWDTIMEKVVETE